ncbi:MAG: RES family NAD+ phosphorylase [Gammaproteobacteria bacterium]|nr:RES family NAD+ phosphorylase [Gammaproteobacteria bacterium]MCY4322973.1 RES family NAD+ phosphorylase [Gammaproteobacteria bacterium]
MLEDVPNKRSNRWIYRFDRRRDLERLFEQTELDQLGRREITELLQSSGYGSLRDQQLLDIPFKRKRKSKHLTRFSDGSFPVLYGSLECKTAMAEVKHWLLKRIGEPTTVRTFFYQRFRYRFEGTVKDLRPKLSDWPELVHDSDYVFCNRIGAEASRIRLDGLVTFSARRPQGSNQPVFTRASVSQPELQMVVAMTYDPADQTVQTKYIDD